MTRLVYTCLIIDNVFRVLYFNVSLMLQMEETLLETLQQEAFDKKFGIVSVYFLVSTCQFSINVLVLS